MLDRIITWLIKRLILLWDRHNDKIAFSFGRDEHTDYAVLVERAYDFWLADDEVNATIQFLQEQPTIIPAEEG